MRQFVPSVYPEDIDPLLFYQDADIERAPQLAQYYQYLNDNNFDAAKNYLANSDLDFYGAWLLNTIENRLYTVEDNIDEYVEEKPKIVIYAEKEPHDYMGLNDDDKFYNWTGSSQPYSIYLNYESENYVDDIWYQTQSGNEPIRSARMIIEDEEGNSMNLRELYHAIFGDGLGEPTDEEIIDLVRFYSKNNSVATVDFTTGYTASELISNPVVDATAKWFGNTNFTISFGKVKSHPLSFEVYDGENMNKNYYLTYDEEAPLIYSGGNNYMHDGKLFLSSYCDPETDSIYLINGANSQFKCNEEYDNYYYDIINYKGLNCRVTDSSILSVDNNYIINTISSGESTITLIPLETYVGSVAYQTGTYNYTSPPFRILNPNGVEAELWLGNPWYGYSGSRSYDFLAFPDSGEIYLKIQVSSVCNNNNYPLITYGGAESSGYFTGMPMGYTITYEIDGDLEYETKYGGNQCKITIPQEWNVDGYPGNTINVTTIIDGLPTPLVATQQIDIAPEQDHISFIPGHDENITLASVGDTTKLPLIVYGHDPSNPENFVVISEPRFLIGYVYPYSYSSRVVNIDSYGNVTALREGTGSYQVHYGGGSVTFNFTVGS